MSNTTGGADNVGAKAGGAISGLFQSIGGAGEAIRGTINQTLDSAGEAAVGRGDGTAPPPSHSGTQKNAGVAEQGKNSFMQGVEKMQGNTATTGTTSTTHTTGNTL